MESSDMKKLIQSAIVCNVCNTSMDVDTLYRCIRCNDGVLYCQECGQHLHWRQKKDHEYSADNIKQVDQINEIQLRSSQQQGKQYLHYLITLYYMRSDNARKEALNVASSLVVAIRSGEGAAKAVAVNAVDLVVDVSQGIKSLVTNANHVASSSSIFKSAMVPVATSAGIATGIVTGLELCYVTYKFCIGDIPDWTTYGRLVTRSIATGVGSFVGNCAGYVTGAAIGSGVGLFAGPSGAAIGALIGAIIGSIACSIAGGASAAQAFDKFWPDEEQKTRKSLVKEALREYGYYKEDDIRNPEKFNEDMIKAKYK